MSGGTNSNIKRQNKQIKKQYKFDKKFRDYQNDSNTDRFEESREKVKEARKNETRTRNYKDRTIAQDYEYKKDLQQQQYDAESTAYIKSSAIYSSQIDLNDAAAELTRESEQRKLDESILAADFEKTDENIANREFKKNAKYDKEANQIKRDSVTLNTQLDLHGVGLERDKKLAQNALNTSILNRKDQGEESAFLIQQAQFDKDKDRITDATGWGLSGNELKFQEASAKNVADSIDTRAELIRTKGAILARGVEGNTATALTQSALADYGRKQAATALSLVFLKKEKTLSDKKTSGTAVYDKGAVASKKSLSAVSRGTSKALSKIEVSKIQSDSDYLKKTTANKVSKLELARTTTLEQLKLSDKKIDKSLKFQQERNVNNRAKIKATRESAKAEKAASDKKIEYDIQAADLQAYGRMMIKPTEPPPVPIPEKLPKTFYIDPTKPRKIPKPIKGAMGKTSVWNTVSDGLGALSSVASIAAPFVSDIKTKHTVEPIENASTKLSSLKPVSFYYTPEYTAEPDRLHHGFVAQEYKEVMPDATYDLKGTLAIDTNDLIGLLVKGHQELQDKIVQLEEKLSATY